MLRSDNAKKDNKDTTKSDEPSELDETNAEPPKKLSEDDSTAHNDGVNVSSAVANEGTAINSPSDNDTYDVSDSATGVTKDTYSNTTINVSPLTVNSDPVIVDVNNISTPTPKSSVASDVYENAREDFQSGISDTLEATLTQMKIQKHMFSTQPKVLIK